VLDGLLRGFRRTTCNRVAPAGHHAGLSSSDDGISCGVCLDALPATAILPCKHVMCGERRAPWRGVLPALAAELLALNTPESNLPPSPTAMPASSRHQGLPYIARAFCMLARADPPLTNPPSTPSPPLCLHPPPVDCALDMCKRYSLGTAACPFCRALVAGFRQATHDEMRQH
jgi:hypothetical protein